MQVWRTPFQTPPARHPKITHLPSQGAMTGLHLINLSRHCSPSHAAGPLYSRITRRGSLNMAYRWLWTPWESAVSKTVYLAFFLLFIKAIVAWDLLWPQRAVSSYSDVHSCMLHSQGMLMLAGTLCVLKIWLQCHSCLLLLISALAATLWQWGWDPNPTGGSGRAPTCFIKFQAFPNE